MLLIGSVLFLQNSCAVLQAIKIENHFKPWFLFCSVPGTSNHPVCPTQIKFTGCLQTAAKKQIFLIEKQCVFLCLCVCVLGDGPRNKHKKNIVQPLTFSRPRQIQLVPIEEKNVNKSKQFRSASSLMDNFDFPDVFFQECSWIINNAIIPKSRTRNDVKILKSSRDMKF